MPDSSRSFESAPRDWGEAFARLPDVAPGVSAWPVIAARTQARTRRTHLRQRWALVAAVAAAVLVPVLVWETNTSPGMSDQAIASRLPAPQRSVIAAAPDARIAATDASPGDMRNAGSNGVRLPEARVTQPDDGSRMQGAPRPAREAGGSGRSATRVATLAGPSATQDPYAARLAALQTESARLEQLLRAGGHDAAAAAPSIVLASALTDEVQRIDGALADPRLDTSARTALWGSRVQALREVAAVETAQRWRNAQGLSMDTALVRVD